MSKRHFMVRRKRDANHKAIQDALEAVGVKVFDLSGVGGGCPDVASWDGSTIRLLEIKTAKGALKQTQQRSHLEWPVHIVRTVDEALALHGFQSQGVEA